LTCNAHFSPGTTPTGVTTAPPTTATGGLDALFKAKGKKYFGSIADAALLNNAQNVAILKAEFGAVTPENSASESIAVFQR
jgi:endo-1,4-beta-xylanase